MDLMHDTGVTKQAVTKFICLLALIVVSIGLIWAVFDDSFQGIPKAVLLCTGLFLMGVGGVSLARHTSLLFRTTVGLFPVILLSIGLGLKIGSDYMDRSFPIWARVASDKLIMVPYQNQHADEDQRAETLLAHFRNRAPPARSILVKGSPDTATDVLAGRFSFLGKMPVSLPLDLSWTEDPYSDRSWAWSLHVMGYIPALVAAYHLDGDLRFLERAAELVFDWISDNQHYVFNAPSPMSWHDHSTALRALNWLPFWEAWVKSPLASTERMEMLLQALVMHADRLSTPDFYTSCHNHGIDQDMTLLSISAWFPELRDSSAWIKLATSRLQEQLKCLISPNGVTLEHSPGYHLSMMRRVKSIDDVFAANAFFPIGVELDATLEAMAEYLAYTLRPDRHLPLIGDTSPKKRPLSAKDYGTFIKYSANLDFAFSEGQSGTPGMPFKIYPEEGYAFFRDSWKPSGGFDQAFYVMFTAAANPGRAHRHWDDLSFVLHAYGTPLIVDPGLFAYNYTDPARSYVVSTAAHNTILIDEKGFEGYATRIEGFLSAEGFAAVRASHDNYPGWRHQRTLVHLDPNQLVIVDDVFPLEDAESTSDMGSRTYDQLFHLDPQLEATLDHDQRNRILVTSPDGRLCMVIQQLSTSIEDISFVRGQVDPMQGWVTKKHGELEPATVVQSRTTGTQAQFVTLITAVTNEADTPLAIKNRLLIHPKGDLTLEQISVDGKLATLNIGTGEVLHVTLQQ